MKPVCLFCTALSLGLFLFNLTGCGSGGGKAKRDKLLTTTEVKQQLMGMTEGKVVTLLGRPNGSQGDWGSDGSSYDLWWDDAATDPNNGKPTVVSVHCEKGVVTQVWFGIRGGMSGGP